MGPPHPPPRSASPGKLSAFEEELYGRGEVAELPAVMAITISYVEGQRQVRVVEGVALVLVQCVLLQQLTPLLVHTLELTPVRSWHC